MTLPVPCGTRSISKTAPLSYKTKTGIFCGCLKPGKDAGFCLLFLTGAIFTVSYKRAQAEPTVIR